MADSLIFGDTYKILEKSLDISARRHSLITGNIANMDTIGYKPMDLDFQETLKKELEKDKQGLHCTNAKHFTHDCGSECSGTIRESGGNRYQLDTVNIDTEMTNLIQNNIKYRTSIEMLLRKMGILKYAISEGGR